MIPNYVYDFILLSVLFIIVSVATTNLVKYVKHFGDEKNEG